MTQLQTMVNELTMRLSQADGQFQAINGAYTAAARELESRAVELARLRERNEQLEPFVVQSHETTQALYNEIHRLQTLLDTIYGSRTWKLHTMVEKMKGRS